MRMLLGEANNSKLPIAGRGSLRHLVRSIDIQARIALH